MSWLLLTMTDFNIDDFLLDADKWAVPDPDYLGDVLDGAVGGDPCATTRTQCAQNLLNLSAHIVGNRYFTRDKYMTRTR